MHWFGCLLLLVISIHTYASAAAESIGTIHPHSICIFHFPHCILCGIVFIASSSAPDTGGPSVVTEGKDALLTCVVMGAALASDTVIWRHEHDGVLSAGMNRVTSDKRISVLHDECE